MPYYRYDPCANCCGCVEDSTYACVCGDCKTRYPKTASIGDDSGTHTLTYSTLPSLSGLSGKGWGRILTLTGYETFTSALGLCAPTPDRPPFDSIQLHYYLQANCTAGLWKLTLVYPVVSCFPAVGQPTEPHYGYLEGLAPRVTATAPFVCGEQLVSFDVPTEIGGLAVPNGGGLLTVVFG